MEGSKIKVRGQVTGVRRDNVAICFRNVTSIIVISATQRKKHKIDIGARIQCEAVFDRDACVWRPDLSTLKCKAHAPKKKDPYVRAVFINRESGLAVRIKSKREEGGYLTDGGQRAEAAGPHEMAVYVDENRVALVERAKSSTK